MITGITVCVNYWDLLSLTIQRWKKFCDNVIVITDKKGLNFPIDEWIRVVRFHETDSFYNDGATFNKGKAIEEALDANKDLLNDWVCFFDADILLPMKYELPKLEAGKLYTPKRRIVPMEHALENFEAVGAKFPIYPESEFAGYFQLFHAPSLERPWYTTNWKHAGGSDSDFQNRFKLEDKIRPDFTVYHLGEPGVNWNGRAQPSFDGNMTEEMANNRAKQIKMFMDRRTNGFKGEKL